MEGEEKEKGEVVKEVGETKEESKSGGSFENKWMLSTGVLAIIVVVLLVLFFRGGSMTGHAISESSAGDRIVEFANSRGVAAEIVGVRDVGGLYEVTLSMNGEELPVHITKDGKYFVQGVIPLADLAPSGSESAGSSEPVEQDLPKTDKPKAELFIMTHCPYGTQAEKGFIPVMESIGDVADTKIRFVHYFMHGIEEEMETNRQLCIREEQSAKFLTYLRCFLNEGNSDSCLQEAKIDKNKLSVCVQNNAASYYAEDAELSQGYGVRGSPSLVVNGVMANSGRDPASYLGTVCSAFNEAPSECDAELSSQTPSPMWGWDASADAAGSAAQCG